MNHVWWRTHLRKLPELGSLERFGNFAEVDDTLPFLMEALSLPSGGRVLELGCGRGSYAVRLAQWGYRVVGVDASPPMIALAEAAARQRGVEVELRRGDSAAITERSAFDGAMLLDFGTASDAENATMMRTVAAALRPGARVVFSTCNPYYWAREPRTEHRSVEGTDVIRHLRFEFDTGTLVSRGRCIFASGERKALPPAHYRAYTVPELRALMSAVGLADLRLHGEAEGRPRPDLPVDSLRTPFFHCVAIRPVHGESGEGI